MNCFRVLLLSVASCTLVLGTSTCPAGGADLVSDGQNFEIHFEVFTAASPFPAPSEYVNFLFPDGSKKARIYVPPNHPDKPRLEVYPGATHGTNVASTMTIGNWHTVSLRMTSTQLCVELDFENRCWNPPVQWSTEPYTRLSFPVLSDPADAGYGLVQLRNFRQSSGVPPVTSPVQRVMYTGSYQLVVLSNGGSGANSPPVSLSANASDIGEYVRPWEGAAQRLLYECGYVQGGTLFFAEFSGDWLWCKGGLLQSNTAPTLMQTNHAGPPPLVTGLVSAASTPQPWNNGDTGQTASFGLGNLEKVDGQKSPGAARSTFACWQDGASAWPAPTITGDVPFVKLWLGTPGSTTTTSTSTVSSSTATTVTSTTTITSTTSSTATTSSTSTWR